MSCEKLKAFLIGLALLYWPLLYAVPALRGFRGSLLSIAIYCVYLVVLLFIRGIFHEHRYDSPKPDGRDVSVTQTVLSEKNKWYW